MRASDRHRADDKNPQRPAELFYPHPTLTISAVCAADFDLFVQLRIEYVDAFATAMASGCVFVGCRVAAECSACKKNGYCKQCGHDQATGDECAEHNFHPFQRLFTQQLAPSGAPLVQQPGDCQQGR